MSVESVMPSNHLILCCSLLLLPSTFPSIRVFADESVLSIRWTKYWSSSISHSNEYSGLISFRMDWLDLLAVQGTFKSPLQHHNSKASILWHSAFFRVQLSHSYMTNGKTIALTRWTSVSMKRDRNRQTKKKKKKKKGTGTSLVIQWLRFCIPNAGDSSMIPDQGTWSHMPQLRVHTLLLNISKQNWRSLML